MAYSLMVGRFLKGRDRWKAVKTSTFKVEIKAGTVFQTVQLCGWYRKKYYLIGPLTPFLVLFIYLFKQPVCFASIALGSCVVPTAGKENLRKGSRHF